MTHVLGAAHVGELLWRQDGELRRTVAVLATYEIGTSGSLVLVPPRALEPADAALRFAGDLAPYRIAVDVLFVGAAHARGASVGWRAGLSVRRGARTLVDRQLYVFGERGPDNAYAPLAVAPLTFERAAGGAGSRSNPLGTRFPTTVDARAPDRPACLAAVPPAWPARSSLLEGASITRDEGVVSLSSSFPWAYFQQAPVEQRLDSVEPTDVFVLDHLSPRSHAIELSIDVPPPSVTIDGAPLAVRLDTVRIDGDASVVSLVWRGVQRGARATAQVVVRHGDALASRPTEAVDPSRIDAPVAPFLQRMKADARASTAAEAVASATTPVDRARLEGPIAPFLLAAAQRGASPRTDGTPWESRGAPAATSVPRPEEPTPPAPAAPVFSPDAALAGSVGSADRDAPIAPGPPVAAPRVETVEERLRRAGGGERALALLAKAFAKKPEPPPSTD